MSIMLDEIGQEPEVVRTLWGRERDCINNIVTEIKARGIRFAMLAARGTSDHAAIYGKYLLEAKCGIPAGLATTSIYTIYGSKMRMEKVLVVGVSQSGEALDVSEYLAKSKESGALTVAMTNCPGSRITQSAEFTIHLGAQEEKAVAATKTYSATLAAFYLLASVISGDLAVQPKMDAVAEDISRIIGKRDKIKDLAVRLRHTQGAVVISRGYNYCTALETALKLTETSCIGVRGYSAADFLHGPIASVHRGDPCIVFIPDGPAANSIKEALGKLQERQAETLVITSGSGFPCETPLCLNLDTRVREDLSPIALITAGHLLAYYLSVERGLDPDKPEGLSKVTLTR